MKLSRSQRTGNPRGYAFVEFADNEVAAIVADTMSGYLFMGERRLVCHIVPQDKIHPELFHGSKVNLALAQAGHTSSYRLKILHDNERRKVNSSKSVDRLNKITRRLLGREKKKREQLKTMGIDYDFPGYAAGATEEAPVAIKKKRKVSEDAAEQEDEAAKTVKKAKEAPVESKKKRKASEDAVDQEEEVAKPAKKTTKTKETPKKAVKEVKEMTKKVKETPKKAVKEMKETPKKVVKEVKETPKKVVKEVKDTPKKVKDTPKKMKDTPKKVVKEMKETPKKVVKEVKETPKKVKEVKETPKKAVTKKVSIEDKTEVPETPTRSKFSPKMTRSAAKKKRSA